MPPWASVQVNSDRRKSASSGRIGPWIASFPCTGRIVAATAASAQHTVTGALNSILGKAAPGQ